MKLIRMNRSEWLIQETGEIITPTQAARMAFSGYLKRIKTGAPRYNVLKAQSNHKSIVTALASDLIAKDKNLI